MKNVNVQKILNSRNEYLKENIIFHEGHLPISVGAGIGAYVSIEYQDKHKQLMNYVNEEFGRYPSKLGHRLNVFAHIYGSASISYSLGLEYAITAGNIRETRANNSPKSRTMDQYNNYIGNSIGHYLKVMGYDFSIENIGDLLGVFLDENLLFNGHGDMANNGFVFPEIDSNKAAHDSINSFLGDIRRYKVSSPSSEISQITADSLSNLTANDRVRAAHKSLYVDGLELSDESRRMFDEIPSVTTLPTDDLGGATYKHNEVTPPIPVHRPTTETERQKDGRQGFYNSNRFEGLVLPASFQKGISASDPTPEDNLINRLATSDIVQALPGVGAALERRSKIVSAQLESRTNDEQSLVSTPIPRPRPKLNPITEGYLKEMPDDGRLILAAEMVGFNGRKEADKAEAARMARFDVQRKMAQDLEDIKVGKVSTVWDRYGHPKAVRDLLGEEAYQSFVDDRLEAGLIAHATAGLHLLQDAELFGIADGTTKLEAPHEKLAELMTPKVLAAAAERARDILEMRQAKPSEAVLLSSDLSNRKAQFDAAFDANEAVDAEEMDAFLFYHEAAQREIGIAEPAIEMIPPRWASQVAARFEATPVDNGMPTDRRAREAELKQHYTELQQSFGLRTDDVIAYSLARTASDGHSKLIHRQ